MTCVKATEKSILHSPLGDLELTTCPDGIHILSIIGVTSDEDFQPNESLEVCIKGCKAKTSPIVSQCIDWLDNYFHNKPKAQKQCPPPICHLLHTPTQVAFTHDVWRRLAADVGYGHTVTYGGLAGLCGRGAGASRAVGQAMRNNPVALIVPCHRVVTSGGQVGNYAGGTKNAVKVWLLKHEGSEGMKELKG